MKKRLVIALTLMMCFGSMALAGSEQKHGNNRREDRREDRQVNKQEDRQADRQRDGKGHDTLHDIIERMLGALHP